MVQTTSSKDVQAYLAELGYDPGPIDGVIGPKTRMAIKAFQGNEGLTVTGEPSDELLEHLKNRTRVARITPAATPADSSYCSRTSLLVTTLVAIDWGAARSGFHRSGECQVSGSGIIRTVRYAYSTPISRYAGNPPVRYTATVARDSAKDMYYLCKVDFGEGDIEYPSQHALCR